MKVCGERSAGWIAEALKWQLSKDTTFGGTRLKIYDEIKRGVLRGRLVGQSSPGPAFDAALRGTS